MHAATWEAPGLRNLADPQALSAEDLKRLILNARAATTAVKEGWFDLSPDQVRQLVSIADMFDEQMRRAEVVAAERTPKGNMLAAIAAAIRGFLVTVQSAGTNRPLMIVAVTEALHLRDAIREQLAKQYAVESAITESAVSAPPDFFAQHEVREAHDAYAAGEYVRLSPSDLRDRAARKVART